MAEDWATNVKKYVPNADDGIIAGIVRYCGIALQKRDSSLVSMTDPKETGRVRENFLKKKLGLTDSDDVLDAAIAAVGVRMKDENFKNRVTVYYLLAEKFSKLDLFQKKAAGGKAAAGAAVAGGAALGIASLGSEGDAAKAAAPSAAPSVVETVKDTAESAIGATGAALGAAGAAVAGAAGAAAAGAGDLASRAGSAVTGAVGDAGAAVSGAVGSAGAAASATVDKLTGGASDDNKGGGLGWLWWLLLAALAAALIWWLFCRDSDDTDGAATDTVAAGAASADADASATSAATTGAAASLAAAPAEGSVAIPEGAGVTSELRDGKPVVKVYFDTGNSSVAPAFAPAASGLKAWLEANAGSSLAVSGFNDPTGDAAANAALSKKRAQAVAAELVKSGIPEASVAMVKPEASTDTTTNLAGARRVEVVVK